MQQYQDTSAICLSNCSLLSFSSSSIYYPGEFSLLVGIGQSFHCSPPAFPIPCILLHYSPLFMSSSTTSIHHFTGLPLFLCPSIFNSNTFFLSTSSSLLAICPNHLNLFCLKCSSRSSTPTLDAITVLTTISFNITPQIILSILFLCGSQPLKNPCFHRPSLCPIHQHAANTCLIHHTFHSQTPLTYTIFHQAL